MTSMNEQRRPNKRRLSRSTAYEVPPNGNALYHRPPASHSNPNAISTPQYTPTASPIPTLTPLGVPFQHSAKSTPVPSPKADALRPKLWGIPLKYLSLITLAVQNASLSIVMHYSRVSVSPSEKYSAASAVLMVELLKGSISLMIALSRIDDAPGILENAVPPSKSSWNRSNSFPPPSPSFSFVPKWIGTFDHALWRRRLSKLRREIISSDCWKLSIPAILYVIQNNLQFVAASNLDVATFQVTYQMKILTTAAFSVLMLGKRLTFTKWLALLFLGVGVGIVQIQSGSTSHTAKLSPDVLLDTAASALNGTAEPVIETVQSAHEAAMNPLVGFLAVSMACMTSGLAGVYFEMVLKGSKADLWVRNVQLSMFSIVPALAPVVLSGSTGSGGWFSLGFLKNFGFWAWSTVFIQVFGGLITAIVIKYSDNILKGFATSLSIVISFLAGVVLFNFQITPTFIVGASTVLVATATYNIPDKPSSPSNASETRNSGLGSSINSIKKAMNGSPYGTLMDPTSPNAPIIGGHAMYKDKKRSSIASLKGLVSSLGLGSPTSAKSTAWNDGAFPAPTFARSSSSSSSASLDNNNISPNGMDPTRYSNSGLGYNTPYSPTPRTASGDLRAVTHASSPYGKQNPPLPPSPRANVHATLSPPYTSRTPSLQTPPPVSGNQRLPSSEYLTVGNSSSGQKEKKADHPVADGRPPQPSSQLKLNGNGWRMSG